MLKVFREHFVIMFARKPALFRRRTAPTNTLKHVWKKQNILLCVCMNVMIPVESEQSVGIRTIVDKSVALEAIEILKQESSPMDSNWNRRHRDNMEKLKKGDILEVAEVVRNLMRVNKQKSLSAGETKMLANARQILISEIILSLEVSSDEAIRIVEEAV